MKGGALPSHPGYQIGLSNNNPQPTPSRHNECSTIFFGDYDHHGPEIEPSWGP